MRKGCVSHVHFYCQISQAQDSPCGILSPSGDFTAVYPFAHAESKGSDAVSVKTNDERVAYLRSLGWEVTPDPVETLSVPLPDTLVEPYLSYNTLQLEQGFDLSAFCGKTLSRYTYIVNNYPNCESGCQADIYLCDDTVVAGDIVCTGENGFMAGLEFPEAQ